MLAICAEDTRRSRRLEAADVSEVWTKRPPCRRVLIRVFGMHERPRCRKVPDGTVLQLYFSVVCSSQARQAVAGTSPEDAKLGRSTDWNLVRAASSRLFIYT